jgi:hypothetical protein
MRSHLITLLLVTMLVAATPCMNAQRMVSGSPRFAGSYFRGGHARSLSYPLAFSDPFYSDYLSTTGYPVGSQPPVIILQAPSAAAPAPENSSSSTQSPSQPLMIELQGDRYVRVSGEETSEAELIDSEKIDSMPNAPSRQPHPSGPAIPPVTAKDLVPAVLVFRDGHREEVSDYMITDGVLYTSGDYYANGSWNRKIELSSLNLPETVKSNQSRSVRFQLPSAPNEVIIRP